MAETIKSVREFPEWWSRLSQDGVPDEATILYRSVALFYRAIQLRCDGLSSVPVRIVKGADTEVEWPYPTPLKRLLWKWESSLLLSGAAYGEIVKNKAGFRKNVIYRNPFDMNVKYDEGILTLTQGTTGTVWTNDLTKGKYEMLYMAEFDPLQDILPGVSASQAAKMDIKLLYALAKFPEAYFEGGAMPVTLLGIDTTDKSEIKRIETWFQRSATAIKNAFRVLGIRAGSINATNLTPPLKDLEFENLNNIARHNIAVAFGIKQTLLDSEAANYATSAEDRKAFYEDTIKPRSELYVDAINEQLLARDGLKLEFDFDEMDIFQEDELERTTSLSNLITATVPLELALDMAGYELTDDQKAMLPVSEIEPKAEIEDEDDEPMLAEIRRWQRMAEKRVKEGKAIREFTSELIPESLLGAISGALVDAKTVDDIKSIFSSVVEWRGYP
jgi:HK97 family phage portal protein